MRHLPWFLLCVIPVFAQYDEGASWARPIGTRTPRQIQFLLLLGW
jgi:hypothetical protein